MKKRVRIYKPTNRFQEGGEQGMQFTPDQLVSIYMTALAEPGASPEIAEDALRQIGVDEDTIAQISSTAGEYMDDQQYLNEAVSTADEDDLADISADQAAIDAAAESEQSALELAEQEARSDAMQQMYADYNEPDYGDDTEMAGEFIQRYGGTPSKRNFVKNLTKQFKKQMGGPSDSARVDPTDPENKRKDILMSFVGSVQESADTALMKKDAEEMYKMLTTPVGGEDSYYQDEDMDYAQFGGMRRGQMRRMNRRMNRAVRRMPIDFYGGLPGVYTYPNIMPGSMPMMPAQGSVYGGPRLANIDVRRTSLFGRPKEYSITFDNDVITNPQLTQEVINQEKKNKEEEVKDEVKATQEGTVDQGVEEKKQAEVEAAAKAAADAEADVDINDIQVVSGRGSLGTTPSGRTPSSKPKGKTDAWGRSPDNKWYGFDPDTKTWTKGKPKTEKQTSSEETTPVKKTSTPVKAKVELSPEMKASLEKRLAKQEAYRRAMGTGTKGAAEVVGRSLSPTGAFGNTFTNIYNAYQALPDWSSVKEFIPFMGSEGTFDYEGAQAQRRKAIGYEQEGGVTDQASGLYKFLYGGNDSTGGKLTQDPYFAYGGLYKFDGEDDSTVDSNTNADTTKKETQTQDKSKINPNITGYTAPSLITRQRRMPYMTGTGQTYTGDLSNAKVAKIDVQKTRAFGPYKGMPKKYTVHYQVERDPLSKRMSFDESGMKIDGRSMADIAPTRQGMFNRQQGTGRTFADKMIDTGVRPLSWLGSKLKPFGIEPEEGRVYTPEEQRMLRKGFDPDTGLTQEELERKRQREAARYAEMQLPTRPVPQPNLPAAQLERTEFVNAPSGITQTLPIRRPGLLGEEREIPEPIFQDYGQPDLSRFTTPNEELAPGEYGPLSESAQAYQEEPLPENQGINLLGLDREAARQAFINEDLDRSREAAIQMELDAMRRQSPEFYDNPIYNKTMEEMEEMLEQRPIPEQVVTAESITPTIGKTQRSTRRPAGRQVTATAQKQTPSTQTQVGKTRAAATTQPTSKEYDYDAAVKGMSRSEKAAFQNKMADASIQLKTLRSQAIGSEDPNIWRDTYRNYKIPQTYINSLNKLNPSQRLQYIKAIKNADRDLYNALLYKYGKDGGYMAYGGTLPQAYIGEDTPIDQDERFKPRTTNFDLGSTNLGNPFLNQGKNVLTGQEAGIKMGTEGEYVNEGVVPEDQLTDFSKRKEYDDVSVDYKTKQKMSGEEKNMIAQMALSGFNALVGKIPERGSKDRTRQIYDRLKSDALFGSTGVYDKGDYEANSGLLRPNQTGFTGRDGGSIYRTGGVAYKVGYETYMSPKQIADYIAKGGEIEFI